MTELDELRHEYDEHVIGEQLAMLIARIVDATAPTYPPSEYSSSGVWNRAALDDAAQDWTLTRLLERGDLSILLGTARSTGALRSLLTRSFGQHLTNQRTRTSATNLFDRTKTMLRSESVFTPVGSARRVGDQTWKLANIHEADHATPGTVERLIKAAAGLTDNDLGVIRYGPYSLKSSPILRRPQLRDFIIFLLRTADGCLTTAQIFEVMRHRFNLYSLPPLGLELEPADRQPLTHVTVENRLIARSVLSRLGYARVRLVKAAVDADYDPKDAAQSADASVADVIEAIDQLQAMIATYAESRDDAESVHRHIIESLYGEDETP